MHAVTLKHITLRTKSYTHKIAFKIRLIINLHY